ncbi:unnamed protein product [Bemisia tabaci]|uniref:Uncharacterized protein n=1 Tax=Bemisia tabaci TaxID=7038 RepID=A0A9P0F7Q0_BEMTA|nr:PREDICTED: small integral membrane protein 20-like [Bemisia tabaci]CAH0393179.1 unnamed protein product [Bemisia tabaci]
MDERVRGYYNPKAIERKRVLKKWGFVAGFAAVITLCMWPIAISPMFWPEKYQEIQKKGRAGLDIEKIQPGGMKVWEDPFGRKKPRTE